MPERADTDTTGIIDDPPQTHGSFPRVGIVGAGQLARMSHPPAVALSIHLSVLCDSATDSAALVIPDAVVGDYRDLEDLRQFSKGVDVVSFDHEHVPADALAALVDDGIDVQPRPEALRFAQDKIAMRTRLTALGVGAPRWAIAADEADVETFAAEVGWPVIAKTPRGGYDGKGVRVVHSPADVSDWLAAVGTQGPLVDGVLLEEAVPFTREVAALVARNPSGETAAWPLVETVQTDGICTEVLSPAPDLDADSAAAAVATAVRIANELEVTGVLAVEMFQIELDGGPKFVVNELAMRPHNSGHWTIDGSITSQFEQHLRAVLDLPLGDTATRATWSVMANVLGGPNHDLYGSMRRLLADDPTLKIHLYGKDVVPGRKIGHVTVYGDDLDDLRRRAGRAAAILRGEDT